MDSLAPVQVCAPASFSALSLFGVSVLSVAAEVVTDYDFDVPAGWRYSQPAVDVVNATFCNVTVGYTHPEQNDTIYAEVWLPVENWNGRLQSIGGGGWVAGRFALTYGGMAGAVHDGYASATTDAGLGSAYTPAIWGLVSEGNLNLVALDDFGQRSLGDLAIIAKQVIKDYYGTAPYYSYWNACSNGGRQAEILAQQYPEAYDGIIAAAPGLYWAELAITSVWPAFYMDLTKQYPEACELAEITSLVTAKCDGLDGVADGIIADPEQCRAVFRPEDYVGTLFNCSDTGIVMKLSSAAISVAEAIWNGPIYSNGDFLWYGYEIGTDLTALAERTCTSNEVCVPTGRSSLDFYYSYFVLEDTSANITILAHDQFDWLYLRLKKVFGGTLSATEPRISDFQGNGGKMITYHGLVDASITPNSSLHYYKEVLDVFDNATDFYRYYRAPGLEHCWGGKGGQPVALFDQLRSWVENGTAPGASPITVTLPTNETMQEVLCPYPEKAVRKESCSNTNTTLGCWSCA